MASQHVKTAPWCVVFILCVIVSTTPAAAATKNSKRTTLNAIDKCWRWDPNWRAHRQQLATCSVGYAGKMTGNVGRGLTRYVVTDPSDNPLDPKPGTLRYGATRLKGKVWITFRNDMRIKLERPLLVSSYTAIDGRGATVHIAGGACLTLQRVSNVIIHGLRIHHCQAQEPGLVMGPEGKTVKVGPVDGDAIRLITSTKIWIDHNTLYNCQDGLVDVTRGSSDITISNNWFRNQDKVMLLGHDDGFVRDRNMRVTVAFNHFGPACNQRMPRVRYGYAHVVNNMYQGWGIYAIGGSMNPSIKSQSNLFVAPKGKKEVIWRKRGREGKSWNLHSVNDVFVNGASFRQTRSSGISPNYNPQQRFQVADANSVKALTRYSGALKCSKRSRC